VAAEREREMQWWVARAVGGQVAIGSCDYGSTVAKRRDRETERVEGGGGVIRVGNSGSRVGFVSTRLTQLHKRV
jgi:hypothetical protein